MCQAATTAQGGAKPGMLLMQGEHPPSAEDMWSSSCRRIALRAAMHDRKQLAVHLVRCFKVAAQIFVQRAPHRFKELHTEKLSSLQHVFMLTYGQGAHLRISCKVDRLG